jgi:hypothetical protein
LVALVVVRDERVGFGGAPVVAEVDAVLPLVGDGVGGGRWEGEGFSLGAAGGGCARGVHVRVFGVEVGWVAVVAAGDFRREVRDAGEVLLEVARDAGAKELGGVGPELIRRDDAAGGGVERAGVVEHGVGLAPVAVQGGEVEGLEAAGDAGVEEVGDVIGHAAIVRYMFGSG